MQEQWKQISGFESYSVSNFGRVWSQKSKMYLTLHPRSATSPYYSVILKEGAKKKNVSVHRLVADAFVPKVAGKDVVNHIDGNKLNKRLSLRICRLRRRHG